MSQTWNDFVSSNLYQKAGEVNVRDSDEEYGSFKPGQHPFRWLKNCRVDKAGYRTDTPEDKTLYVLVTRIKNNG